MSDSFTTAELMAATQQVFKFDPLFLRLFFRETYTFTSEEVLLDTIPGDVNMAVYCSPLITGKVDRTRGYSTNRFKPGYTKPKHTVNPNMSIKRAPGEQIGEPETPAERNAKLIMQNLADEELSICQLEEYQAVQAVLYGKYEISGANIETYEIDLNRSDENNITQSGSTAWSAQDADTYDPSDDIESYADQASGAVNVIVMDGKAWKQLKRFKKFWAALDTRRGSNSQLEVTLKDLGDVVSFKGYYGDTALVVYKGQYVDPSRGTKKRYLPDGIMVLGNLNCRGFRTYGAILDQDALNEGISEATRYPKTWTTTGDPAVTQTMTQSAPAMVLGDANAFVVVQVA
ncbi:major capsid protein [Salmonella enterica subsp. enterica serovar Aba]|nr:major capsid protein [Salmonella enterica subsp. enterica serovar Aba]EBY6828045.1 major capsid protein [Salmonella enterica subsp. enterica serovar Aba]